MYSFEDEERKAVAELVSEDLIPFLEKWKAREIEKLANGNDINFLAGAQGRYHLLQFFIELANE
jgi:hypothetical protein